MVVVVLANNGNRSTWHSPGPYQVCFLLFTPGEFVEVANYDQKKTFVSCLEYNTYPRSQIQIPRNPFGVVNYDQRKTWSPLSSTADALSPGQLFQSPQILILQNQNRVNLGNKCIFFGIEYLILQKIIWRNIAFYFPAFFNRLTLSDLFRSGPFSDIWAKPIPIDEVTSTIGHGYKKTA